MDPLNPFGYGVPGDPMEDVLSLQAYDQGLFDEPPINTQSCPITFGCTVSCPPKVENPDVT